MDIYVLLVEEFGALFVLEPQSFTGFLSLNRFRLLHTPVIDIGSKSKQYGLGSYSIVLKTTSNLDHYVLI